MSNHPAPQPYQIADDCVDHFNALYPSGYPHGYKRNQLVKRAYNTNAKSRGGNELAGIENERMVNGNEDEDSIIMRGNMSFVEPNDRCKQSNQQQRCVAFSTPQLMDLMRQGELQEQVDCTFRCCHIAFYQCLIWIIWDKITKSFVPAYWVLMSGKTAACYNVAFFMMKNDLGGGFNPFCVGIDFERNFINMVKIHWPMAELVGCFFHFKQAMRRKLVSLKFDEEYVVSRPLFRTSCFMESYNKTWI